MRRSTHPWSPTDDPDAAQDVLTQYLRLTPVTWQLDVNNVFDKTYYASGGFNAQPGAPRALTGSVRIEF